MCVLYREEQDKTRDVKARDSYFSLIKFSINKAISTELPSVLL